MSILLDSICISTAKSGHRYIKYQIACSNLNSKAQLAQVVPSTG